MEDWLLPLQQGQPRGGVGPVPLPPPPADLRHHPALHPGLRRRAWRSSPTSARSCARTRCAACGLRAEDPNPRARFSTWLVAVVRHAAVDWFRHRDGRHRLSPACGEVLPPRRRTHLRAGLRGQPEPRRRRTRPLRGPSRRPRSASASSSPSCGRRTAPCAGGRRGRRPARAGPGPAAGSAAPRRSARPD